MSTLAFYRSQAERERGLAASASLSNVKERCERAAAAWSEMADRLERTEEKRAVRAAETAARTGVAVA